MVNLQVPGDAEIVLWALASERPTALQLPSSRFSEDVAEIHAASAAVSKPPSSEPYKTLSGLPLSPVCALETPFGSTPSDASGAVSSQSNSGEFPGGQPAASSPLTGRWRRIWGCNTLQAVAADRRNNPRPQQVADAPPSFDEHHAGGACICWTPLYDCCTLQCLRGYLSVDSLTMCSATNGRVRVLALQLNAYATNTLCPLYC